MASRRIRHKPTAEPVVRKRTTKKKSSRRRSREEVLEAARSLEVPLRRRRSEPHIIPTIPEEESEYGSAFAAAGGHVMHRSTRMDWGTPPYIVEYYDEHYHFGIDLAANEGNTVCDDYFSEENNSLEQEWGGDMVGWLNPPYGRGANGIAAWMEKCARSPATVVSLVPMRLSRWFFQWVWPYASQIDLIEGRIRFVGADSGAPFDSTAIHWSRPLTGRSGFRVRSDDGPLFRHVRIPRPGARFVASPQPRNAFLDNLARSHRRRRRTRAR